MATRTFELLDCVSDAMGESRDCGVKAMALAAQLTYKEAHEAMRRAGRRFGQGSRPHMYIQVLEEHGFLPEIVDTHGYDAPHKLVSRTVRTLEREIRRKAPNDTFLIRTRGHVLCYTEGELHDWTKGRMHRIVEIWRIVDTNPPEEDEE